MPLDQNPQNSSNPTIASGHRRLPKSLLLAAFLVAVAAAGLTGYLLGKAAVPTDAPTANQTSETEIKVPTDATVTAECIEGLGKQYVVPKDIPFGPIYNVHDGRVVSIEYMFNISELTKNPARFMNLQGFSNQFDHINIDSVPIGHAGNVEPHFHVDLFKISAAAAAQIKCSPAHQETTH